MTAHYKEGLWEVSPYNFDADVREGMDLPEQVSIMDVTLREGRQADGVFLRLDDVVEVARRLGQAGLPMIEMHHDEPKEMQEVKKLGLGVKIQAIIHPLATTTEEAAREAVGRCLDNGADIVCFALPLSEHHFATYEKGGVDVTREQALELAAQAVQAAKNEGATVSCNLLDFSRIELDWLKQQAVTLAQANSDIIRIDDIASPCLPAVMRHHIKAVKQEIPDTTIAVHTHNDFGLASALVLAGLEGGAEIIEGGVNGIGERSGVPNLAEIVAAVELLYGYDTGIDLSALTDLSQFVSGVYNQPVPESLPVVGKRAFAHGIEGHHLSPEDVLKYNPFSAELVGNEEYVPFCNYSGPYAVQHKCQELGMDPLPHEVAAEVANAIKRELRFRKHPISDAVFRELVDTVRSR